MQAAPLLRHSPSEEFVRSLSASQRNALRLLMSASGFEVELSLALTMLTGIPVGGWDLKR